MKTTVPIHFEVEADEEMTEREARCAAELAAFHHLAFVNVSGYGSDVEDVTVHVDGFGDARVKIIGPEES